MSETVQSQLNNPRLLQRRLGLGGATALGLGAIVGTGVFVTLPNIAISHGYNVLVGILVAAVVATCNGLSSAQLAAAFPVSGGTYEYGHRLLNPISGFLAGWLFLCAKTCSAAAAVLGAAHYLQLLLPQFSPFPSQWIALALLLLVATINWFGIRSANWFNALLVAISLSSMGWFVWEIYHRTAPLGGVSVPAFPGNIAKVTWRESCEAAALMFVAFTGYGRIATLGEEVQEPRRTIPRAVIVTLTLAGALYLVVAVAVLLVQGLASHDVAAAELEWSLLDIAKDALSHGAMIGITCGALAAMLAVENNLLLGLSRVVLAMGRRSDLPSSLSWIDSHSSSPRRALLGVTFAVGITIMFANFKLAWEFSALTILVYYALTNFCALRLSGGDRMFPVWFAFTGLTLTCLLALFISPKYWMAAIAVTFLGLVVRWGSQKWSFPAKIG